MSGNTSAGIELLISRSAAADAVRSAIRLFVGRGRRYTVKQLSNATGVPDRQIECAMERVDSGEHRCLKPEELASISLFLGAAFTTEWLGVARQGAFDLPDDADPRPGDLAVDSTDCAAGTVRTLADGVIDFNERSRLKEIGQRDVNRGVRLIKMAGRIS